MQNICEQISVCSHLFAQRELTFTEPAAIILFCANRQVINEGKNLVTKNNKGKKSCVESWFHYWKLTNRL